MNSLESIKAQPNVLYVPSTPLNILVAVAHAVHFAPQQRAQLVLIDQKNVQDNAYYQVLKNWPNSPFEQVFILPGKATGLGKVAERKANFEILANVIKSFAVDVIATGSDRRIEFQYLMQLGRQKNPTLKGWYLDDGLYSYAGRAHHWFNDSISSLLKKAVYGHWWQEPKTVGASNWINQAWLFRPEQAVSALQKKQMKTLDISWFTAPDVQIFSVQMCALYGLQGDMLVRLQSVDCLLLVPHPNNIQKMSGYVERIEGFLQTLYECGQKVAVKYHPRALERDALKLETRFGVILVPERLAFEFVLPNLPAHTQIIGDVGTALLTTKWLRPELNGVAVLNEDSAFERAFKPILHNLEVRVVQSYESAYEAVYD